MSARHWCYTDNNPTITLNNDSITDLRYHIYQLEEGDSGTKHNQGYMEFGKTQRLSALKKLLPHAHWEKRLGTPTQAAQYCKKSEGRLAGPFEWGKISKGAGERLDIATYRQHVLDGASDQTLASNFPGLFARYPRFAGSIRRLEAEEARRRTKIDIFRSWQQSLLVALEAAPDPRTVHWLWDRAGGTGKTTFSKHLVDNMQAFYSNGGKHADITYAYNGEKIAIFDFVRSSEEFVCYSVIEAIKNGILTISKYESQTRIFDPPHVICFANFFPDCTKLSEDRWNIVELNE